MPNSSYLQYLPPVLWSPSNDPQQTLGRHLRIYEKILTGLSADGLVVRASASFSLAKRAAIQLVNAADAARFAAGDWITVEGTTERRQIADFHQATVILDADLMDSYLAGGTVRIADLVPGQIRFRADNAPRVDAGYPLEILQAGTTEAVVVAAADASFITLRFGLARTYSLAVDAVPVKLIDAVVVKHEGKPIASLEAQIDDIFKLFNPWRADAKHLRNLASWVALTLPQDEPGGAPSPSNPQEPRWSEYQKRKLISHMTDIYQLRGLKQGIYAYLDIYAVAAARPRVAVDDGEAIFRARFSEDRTALLHAFAHSNTVSPLSDSAKTISVLMHPTGIGADSKNQFFVCDEADVSLKVPRRPALWRVKETGEIDYVMGAGLPMPMPKPLHSGAPMERPCAITVDASDRVAVLDTGNTMSSTNRRSAIYRFLPPAYNRATVIDQTSAPTFPAVHPVDMCLNAAGHFVVLDRGLHPLGDPPSGNTNPQIVVVQEGPLAIAVFALPAAKEPTALLAAPAGKFLVADANDQKTTLPADILMADPAAGWVTTSLLGGMTAGANPLVFPTGMVWEAVGVLLVCDAGLRWGVVDPSSNTDKRYRVMAEPAHLYRVDLNSVPPVITRVTTRQQLVQPTKLAWDRNGNLLITDRGAKMTTPPQRNWRAGFSEFGVVLYFSGQRPTTPPERNAYRRAVVRAIESEQVGHASSWMDF